MRFIGEGGRGEKRELGSTFHSTLVVSAASVRPTPAVLCPGRSHVQGRRIICSTHAHVGPRGARISPFLSRRALALRERRTGARDRTARRGRNLIREHALLPWG